MKQKLWIVLLFAAFWSCETEEKLLTQQRVTFALVGNQTLAKTGNVGLHSVIVTVTDLEGNVVIEHQELLLRSFGTGYVSDPAALPMKHNPMDFKLTEFLVVNDSLRVVYVTPIEGSDLAHLVNDPLAIEFSANQDQIVTVTPEVIEVNPNNSPQAYGYANFDFHVVPTLRVFFDAVINGSDIYTDFHLKVEELLDTLSSDSLVIGWTYEKDIREEPMIIQLRKALAYRITATKEGYPTWQEISLLDVPEYTVNFEADSASEVDIYVGGRVKINNDNFATYWKNDEPHRVDNDPSSIYAMTVVNDQVFAIGNDKTQENKAFYWHNDQQIMLPHTGMAKTTGIVVHNKDIYVSGYLFEYMNGPLSPAYLTPVYWKNGEMITLSLPEGEFKWGYTTGIGVDNGQVYIAGTKRKQVGSDFTGTPVTWVNGILIDLQIRPDYTTSYAYGMVMENGHTYTLEKSGTVSDENSHFGYWTDLGWKDLNVAFRANIFMISASQPVVEDGNFYFLPHSGANRYFKDGTAVTLSGKIRELYGLDVVNGVVYVSGQYREQTGPYTGCYWVDGERHDLKPNDMAWCIVAQKRS